MAYPAEFLKLTGTAYDNRGVLVEYPLFVRGDDVVYVQGHPSAECTGCYLQLRHKAASSLSVRETVEQVMAQLESVRAYAARGGVDVVRYGA